MTKRLCVQIPASGTGLYDAKLICRLKTPTLNEKEARDAPLKN